MRMGNLNLIPECKIALYASVPEKHWQELRGEENEEEAGGVDSWKQIKKSDVFIT